MIKIAQEPQPQHLPRFLHSCLAIGGLMISARLLQRGISPLVMIVNRNAVYRTDLVSHLVPGEPLVAERLSGYTHYFATKGFTDADAQAGALKLLDNAVTRQSNVLSFGDAYLLIGLLFLLALPLLVLAGPKKATGKPAPVILSDH